MSAPTIENPNKLKLKIPATDAFMYWYVDQLSPSQCWMYLAEPKIVDLERMKDLWSPVDSMYFLVAIPSRCPKEECASNSIVPSLCLASTGTPFSFRSTPPGW